MTVDSEVDLALIRSEALYCLRKEQLVNLCKRRGINPKGKTNQLIDALRESIKAEVYKQPKISAQDADSSQNFRLDPVKPQDVVVNSESSTSRPSPHDSQLSSQPQTKTLARRLSSPSVPGTLAQKSSDMHCTEPVNNVAEVESVTSQSTVNGLMPIDNHPSAILPGSNSGDVVETESVTPQKQREQLEQSVQDLASAGQAAPHTDEESINSVPHDHSKSPKNKTLTEANDESSNTKLTVPDSANAPASPLRRKLSQLQKPLKHRVSVKKDHSQFDQGSSSTSKEVNSKNVEQAPEVPPKHAQHRVVMFSNDTKQEKAAMHSVPNPLSYASKQSALESNAKQSLFPELRHDTMYFKPEDRQPEKPLTHGDVRRIYAELLAERDAQRAKKLPNRLGNFVRKIKGLKGAASTSQNEPHKESYPSSDRSDEPRQGHDAQLTSLDIADTEMLRAVIDGCDAEYPQPEESLPVLNVGEYGKAVQFSMPTPDPTRESVAEIPAIALTTPSIPLSIDEAAAGPAINRDSARSSPRIAVKEMKRKLDTSSEEEIEKPRRRKRCTAVALDVTNLAQNFTEDEQAGGARSPASICEESGVEPRQDLAKNANRRPKSLRTTTRFGPSQENGSPKKSVRFSATDQPIDTHQKTGLPRRQLRANALR
ncbi:hypothetical protein MPSI1_001810 [Malassezia psittaci]|uniref:Uncharacterized protein n=1 Tax=Malassezia psittaci TaxID=1821823 RepID=A0AAF0F9D7_9BASI|nr:hypothetical protein MPSI1_001810 [Malassezia psittaci]